jgi:hypothetical protein
MVTSRDRLVRNALTPLRERRSADVEGLTTLYVIRPSRIRRFFQIKHDYNGGRNGRASGHDRRMTGLMTTGWWGYTLNALPGYLTSGEWNPGPCSELTS